QAVAEGDERVHGGWLLRRRSYRDFGIDDFGLVGTVIELDAFDHLGRRDKLHAAGDAQVGSHLDRIKADVVVVLGVAIPDGLTAGLPTAAVRAAGERADCAEVLMSRVRLPVRRFAAAGDDDTGTMSGPSRLRLDGSREVHGERDGAEYAVRVVNETDEAA